MNRAVMIAIQPKWAKMIIDGEKTFEFRNYAIPKGTKVYLYESLGKKHKEKEIQYPYGEVLGWEWVHEGKGKVVAEFVVGECYDWENDFDEELKFANDSQYSNVYFRGQLLDEYDEELWNIFHSFCSQFAPTKEWENQGFTNQRYAHEIQDLIVYDEEWMLERRKLFADDIHDVTPSDWELGQEMGMRPTEPLAITEFVSWKKLVDYKKYINKLERETGDVGYLIENEKQAYDIGKSWERVDENKYQNLKWDMYITHPPQGKIYVVEREE